MRNLHGYDFFENYPSDTITLLHETGHQWGIYWRFPELNLVWGDDVHWSPFFDAGLDPLSFFRAMSKWEQENVNTFRRIPTKNFDVEPKYHPFILYRVGLLEAEEINESFKLIIPDISSTEEEIPYLLKETKERNIWEDGYERVNGTAMEVTIDDLIRVYGRRTCIN